MLLGVACDLFESSILPNARVRSWCEEVRRFTDALLIFWVPCVCLARSGHGGDKENKVRGSLKEL